MIKSFEISDTNKNFKFNSKIQKWQCLIKNAYENMKSQGVLCKKKNHRNCSAHGLITRHTQKAVRGLHNAPLQLNE